MIGTLISLFWLVMQWIGVAAVVLFTITKLGPQVSERIKKRMTARHLSKVVDILGSHIALVRTKDGNYQFAPAEYDPENSLLWVDYGNEKKGYSVGGMGDVALPFHGSNLSLVYEGLGSAGDIVSAKVGREAKANYEDHVPSPTEDMLDFDESQPPAIADGGEERELEKDEIVVPTSGVVADLRNFLYFAPYHVRPAAFDRVEKNAKAGMHAFSNWGPIAQTGGMLGAFFLGALVAWWVSGDSGGSSGGGSSGVDVVPLMADVVTSGVIA